MISLRSRCFGFCWGFGVVVPWSFWLCRVLRCCATTDAQGYLAFAENAAGRKIRDNCDKKVLVVSRCRPLIYFLAVCCVICLSSLSYWWSTVKVDSFVRISLKPCGGGWEPKVKKKHEMSRNESDFDPDICIHQSLNMRFLTKEWSERCWQGFSNLEFEGRNFSNAQTAGTWIFTIWWCLMIFESRYLDDLGHLFNKPSVRFALSIEGFQVQDLSLWTEEMQEQRLFLFQQSMRRVVFLWGKIL